MAAEREQPTFDVATLAASGFPVISFDALTVGETFRSDERTIRPSDVDAYAFAVEDHDPWFFEPGPFGGPIVHPTLLANQALFLRNERYFVPAGLHARMQLAFERPVMLGTTARTTGEVAEKYVRRGKPYMVTEFETRDETNLLTRGRIVQMLFQGDTAPAHGSGPKPDVEPEALDPDITGTAGRSGPLEIGQTLDSLTRTLSQRQIDAYSGVRPGSIHTDESWARAKGFPTTIAQGMMSAAYVSTLMTAAFGRGFVEGGRLDIRFLRPTFKGDTITIRGNLRGVNRDGDRVFVDVSAQNQNGADTMAGTASARAPRAGD